MAPDGNGSPVAAATGSNVKPLVSLVFYAAAAGLAFVSPWISYALFAAVAAMWFVPFRRLSRWGSAPPADSVDGDRIGRSAH